MVKHLKVILPSIIGPTQCSFVPGRHISDNIMIFHEVVHYLHSKRSGKGYIVLKIDLEKAYNRLSWDFVRTTLEAVSLDDQ